jgi:putative transposase
MNATMTAQFVTDALPMEVWRRGKPDALLHHFHGIICRMTVPASSGTMLRIETFLPLKTERTERKNLQDQRRGAPDVSLTSRGLRHDRRHSTIG